MRNATVSERGLVLAPRGRDATIALAMLGEAGIAASACASLPGLVAALDEGAGFALVTEEALGGDLHPLAAWLGAQPEWSDFPFVLLTSRGGGLQRNPAASRHLDTLGNVAFLERPFHPTTLVSLARAALRGRRRQYEARARLEALRESEDHYRHAVELNPQVAWTSGPDGQLDRVARRWFDWTGTTGLGGTWGDAMHPDDLQPSLDAWAAALASGEPYDIQHRVRMRNGTHHWMHSRAYARRDAAGRIVKWYGATEDIEARKVAEAALRESERQFRTLAELMPAMCFMAGADGDIFWYNQRWHDYTGRSAAELAGWGWRAVHDPAVLPEVERRWRASLASGEPFEMIFPLRAATGDYRPFLTRVEPIRDEEGVLVRWFGANTDISEQRRIAEQLETLNDELAARVARAVAERETALGQLHEAQKLETMGQLTGGVAHDFNNLLTPITGALDLLHRQLGDSDARAARLLGGAIQSAERAKLLVQRLLGFARRQALQTAPRDLAALIHGMRDLIASSVGSAVELRLRLADGLPAAMIDLNQLELAILNLCVNARDAMPAGGVLTIDLDRADPVPSGLPPGDYLRLSVIDTGTGMNEATLARAIEPFYSTKGVGRGTGLGLSMVHGLAAQLGGAFTLASRPGEGTRCDLFLPVAAAGAEPNGPQPQGLPRGSGSRTVLLVDDETAVRAVTAEMLRELGHVVREAGEAPEALALLSSGFAPDLLVSDYMMPRMSGVELARRARARWPELPVLLITGFAGEMRERDLPYLGKPFRQADLAEAIDALFAEPAAIAEVAPA